MVLYRYISTNVFFMSFHATIGLVTRRPRVNHGDSFGEGRSSLLGPRFLANGVFLTKILNPKEYFSSEVLSQGYIFDETP